MTTQHKKREYNHLYDSGPITVCIGVTKNTKHMNKQAAEEKMNSPGHISILKLQVSNSVNSYSTDTVRAAFKTPH